MKPLEGITVVDLSTYVAAPTCGRILASQGARVIKVEPPQGDVYRGFGPTVWCPAKPDENPMYDMLNGGKEFVSLDLKKAEDIERFHKLLSKADVFLTNNRPQALKKLGLDYDTLKVKYPKLIYAIVLGYGEEGPMKDFPGLDGIAMFARGGFMRDIMIDDPHSYPPYLPLGMGDLTTGTILAGSIGTALYGREKSGKGDYVSLSLYGLGLWIFSIMSLGTQYGYQWPRARYQGGPMGVPYKTKDNRWILPVVMEYERFFKQFCKAVNADELIDDPRFNTKAATFDPKNREDCIKIFEEKFSKLNLDEVLPKLDAADITCAELTKFIDNHSSEQALVNKYIVEHAYPSKTITVNQPPMHIESCGDAEFAGSKPVGTDNEKIFKEFDL